MSDRKLDAEALLSDENPFISLYTNYTTKEAKKAKIPEE